MSAMIMSRCPVFDRTVATGIFSDKETIDKVYAGCRSAGIGCIECKSWAADHLIKTIAPMQERRRKYEQNPKLAWDIVEAGDAKARASAEDTMEEVRAAMGLSHHYEPPQRSARESGK